MLEIMTTTIGLSIVTLIMTLGAITGRHITLAYQEKEYSEQFIRDNKSLLTFFQVFYALVSAGVGFLLSMGIFNLYLITGLSILIIPVVSGPVLLIYFKGGKTVGGIKSLVSKPEPLTIEELNSMIKELEKDCK